MKIWRLFIKSPVRVIVISRRRSTVKFKRAMIKLKIALATEKKETKEMLIIYKNYTQGKSSKAEMKVANQQFLEVIKGLGLGVFAILPFAPITIPLAIKLSKRVGVDLLPSAFSSEVKTPQNKIPKTKVDET